MMNSFSKSKSKYESLTHFLMDKRSAKNEKCTHTGMAPTRGRYCIEDNDLPEFYDLYY